MRGRSSRCRTFSPCGAGILLAVVATCGVASAQVVENLPLARTYGSGVHAFFCGDYDRSYEDLTAAIEAGSQDPRARYFRGLAALRLGRLDEAEADFAAGADLETRALGGWPVSRSLERVQGHDRLRLERHRARARVAAHQRDLDAERIRYSDTMDAQDDVRRRWRPTTIPPPSGAPVTNLFEGRPQPEPVPVAPAPGAADEPLPAPRDAAAPGEDPVEEEPGIEPGVNPFEPQPNPEPNMELPPAEESVEPLEAEIPLPGSGVQ